MHDVFLSYSSKDSEITNEILDALESQGIKCWIAYRDIKAGDDYAAAIVHAIRACKVMVLVYSENSNASAQVLNEINSATNAAITILPFKIDDFKPSDSFEYYLGKTHWINAMKPPITSHIKTLTDRLKSLLPSDTEETEAEKKPAARSSGACRIASYEDLMALGYTSFSVATQLVENDYIIYNGIGIANEGTVEQWEDIVGDFSDSVIYLLNAENKIVGEIHTVALPKALFDRAKSGKLLESEIAYDEIEFYGFPGDYYGYILSIGIMPGYRSTKNIMLLLNKWVERLEELSEEGVFFKEFCINVCNRETESLVKGMGFRYLCDNIEFGKIHALDFLPLPQVKFFRQHKRLLKNYERHDKESEE